MAADKIRSWKGGKLRVYTYELEMVPARKDGSGEQTYRRTYKRRFVQSCEATPYGDGLALLKPTKWEALPGVWVTFEVRDGRPQAVAIESEPNGPELTQTLLRKISLADAAVVQLLRNLVVRLELNSKGNVVGFHATSARHPTDFGSTFEERSADAADQTAGTRPRRGRPPLSNEVLQEVADVYGEALAARDSVIRAVAQHFGISTDAAKKRITTAKGRGLIKTAPRAARMPARPKGGTNG